MASEDKELELKLVEAGNKLVDPPPSVDELLSILDQVENCLAKVEQSPSKSMQSSLAPSLKALVADQLFRHSNVDVKVAVASCISEITRITAPDAPYDDEQMKDVFQLIVSSFENLADKSSRSYSKRTSILETVAKVRSCVVMLDLECDALIIEMFQLFLKSIRDYHPENVFSSMETIMNLVLEESEDISAELLSLLLDSVRKGNEEVLPVALKLGEKVLESCASKVKPYLIRAVKSLGLTLDDYSDVVASICQEMSGAVDQDDIHIACENKVEESEPIGASSDDAGQANKEAAAEAASPKQGDPVNDKSVRSVLSNGVAQTGEDDPLADPNSFEKQEDANCTDQSKCIEMSSNSEPDTLDVKKVVNIEGKPEQTTRKKGKNQISSMKLLEASESSLIDTEKEAEKVPYERKDVPSSPHENAPVEAAVSSENQKENGSQSSSPKAMEAESITVTSPSVSGSLPDEVFSKKTGRPRKKESLVKDPAPVASDVPKKSSKSESEAKKHKHVGRKALTGASDEDKTTMMIETSKKGSGATSDSEAKLPKKSSKKDVNNNNEDGSSLKQSEDKRQRSRGRAILEKNMVKSSSKDDEKEIVSSPKSASKSKRGEIYAEETPKTNTKRKRTPGKEKATDIKDHGEDLVGTKVKVWWPMDHKFYEGVVDFYDPVKKKHKILYNDGDEEVLNLKKEKWEIIGSDSQSVEAVAANHPSPDTSSEVPLKKKMKTNSDKLTKQGKDASPKQGGASSKSKSLATKSGRKSKEVDRTDGKSVDDTVADKKIEDDGRGKTKDHTSKTGSKTTDVTSKTAGKSENDDIVAPKTGKSKEDGPSTPKTSKSKQETPKIGKSKQDNSKVATSNDKGKSAKGGGKSNFSGTGKSRSGSAKLKENEDKENSEDSDKVQERTKGKSISSKGKDIETKSGKKRQRGA